METILKRWKQYCSDDLSLIENYENASLNPENYVIHHRLGEYVPRTELISHGLYYYRPAKELIFLTKSQHSALHAKLSWKHTQSGHTRTKEQMDRMVKTKEERKIFRTYQILCITTNTIYNNAVAAMKDLGFLKTSNIYKCCNGERKSAKGYQFEYYFKNITNIAPALSNS